MPALTTPGHRILNPEILKDLKGQVKSLLKTESSKGFPGSQPVSFTKSSKQALLSNDYYVCEKSDGLRFLLFINNVEIDKEKHVQKLFLINRKNEYYQIFRLSFPATTSKTSNELLQDTILDGELVLDTSKDGTETKRFLVFDCLLSNGKLVTNKYLNYRLGVFNEHVLKPHKAWLERNQDKLNVLPFQMEFKKMELGYGIKMMFDVVIPNLEHGCDGLIFTPINTVYKTGTDNFLLKWKPADENSVDFKCFVEVLKDKNGSDDYSVKPRLQLWAYVGKRMDQSRNDANDHQYYADLTIDDQDWENLSQTPLNGAIIECVRKDDCWRFMRFRSDKRTANHISIISKIEESIQDGVRKEELLDMAFQIRQNYKARHANQESNLIKG